MTGLSALVDAWQRWEDACANARRRRPGAATLSLVAARKEDALCACTDRPARLHDAIVEARRAGDDVAHACARGLARLAA